MLQLHVRTYIASICCVVLQNISVKKSYPVNVFKDEFARQRAETITIFT